MPACPGTGSHSSSGATAVRPAASDGEAVPASRADLDRPLGSVPSPVTVLDQQSFEIGLPNIARINDALLGGSYDQLVEELGPDFPAAMPPVLRSVLFVLERHEAKLVTAMTIIAGGAR